MKKILFVSLILVFGFTVPTFATQIDLNDFYADTTVTVSVDGWSALLEEDSSSGIVLLSNDPIMGEPHVIIPGVGVNLFFEYAFTEDSSSDDEFSAFVWDVVEGMATGVRFDFFTQESKAGVVEFDLSSLVSQTLGLQFQLTSLSGDGSDLSTVEVFNVRLEQIPEPAPMMLMGMGLLFIASVSRRKK